MPGWPPARREQPLRHFWFCSSQHAAPFESTSTLLLASAIEARYILAEVQGNTAANVAFLTEQRAIGGQTPLVNPSDTESMAALRDQRARVLHRWPPPGRPAAVRSEARRRPAADRADVRHDHSEAPGQYDLFSRYTDVTRGAPGPPRRLRSSMPGSREDFVLFLQTSEPIGLTNRCLLLAA